MDANGSRYALLLGQTDWLLGDGTEYDDDREEVILARDDRPFPAAEHDTRPQARDRRGADCDRYGSRYWIDAAGAGIRVQGADSSTSADFWRPGMHGPRAPHPDEGEFFPDPPAAVPASSVLRGLAVTEDQRLVAGTLNPPGLLVFDLLAAGPPRQLAWAVPFAPLDLSARLRGGVFVLDDAADPPRLWELDERLHVVARDPDPAAAAGPGFVAADAPGAQPRRPARRLLTAADARPLDAGATAIAATAEGRVVVLGRTEADAALTLVDPASGTASEPVELDIAAHDLALVAGPGLGTAFVAEAQGNQAYAYRLAAGDDGALSASPGRRYLPMRRFGGRGLVADRRPLPTSADSDDLPVPTGVLYDFGDGWVPLVEQRRPRHVSRGAVSAPLPLDAGVPGTVWHRVMLDARIPPGAAVRLFSRASDEPPAPTGDHRLIGEWREEPAFSYRRATGSELPFAAAQPAGRYDTYEVLLQAARGRWLELRLELEGDGRVTPRLRALRAYFPRFSYLSAYLPDVYAEDGESAWFLDRFLANLEGINTGIEDRVAAAETLLDPRATPVNALDWLLGWFGVAADPAWDDERRRAFLRHAAPAFALRGTAAGLRFALRLALDRDVTGDLLAPQPPHRAGARIVERFATRPTPVAGRRVWVPGQGREALRQLWRDAVDDQSAELAPWDTTPAWRSFMGGVLGTPAPEAFTGAEWTEFLTTRYGTVAALDAAHGTRHAAIADAGFPEGVLPAEGPALTDWYQFLALSLPAQRAAHRFTILLGVPAAAHRSPEEHRAIARRVVELVKPAHTTFDIAFFWAAFRLGEARLGEDTLLDLGGRDPRLLPDLVLGDAYAGETHLGGATGPTTDHTGRDPLNG